MRIAHISTLHAPFDVRIFHKECRTLAAAGHDVHSLVHNPPASNRDGVRFHALGSAGGLRPLRIWRRLRDALHRAAELSADVYHIHDAELIPVAWSLKRRGARVIYDVHEDSPQEVLSLNRGSYAWAKWAAFKALWSWAGHFVDRFVCATPAIARLFPADRTVTIHNYPLLAEFQSADAAGRQQAPSISNILYAGIISAIRGAPQMVAAMEHLSTSPSARLLLIGECHPPGLEAELRRLPGWRRVEFLHWLPRHELAHHLAQARCGLVLFLPGPNHTEALPNKLFEYMAAGLPVVVSDFPLWRRLVEETGCGLVANPTDPKSIADAITQILESPDTAWAMGRRGAEAIRAKYNWESQGRALLALYDEMARQRMPPAV